MVTPLKTNVEPENPPLEKEKHLQTTNFWVPCLFLGGVSLFMLLKMLGCRCFFVFFPGEEVLRVLLFC